MRKILAAGNWKMHGSRAMTSELLGELKRGLEVQEKNAGCAADVLVCPAAIHLAQAAELLAESPILLGAQNLAVAEQGAFTGEISGPMLADMGCSHVLVGHSERRALFGESNELVAEKFIAAQSAGLIPILCLGETLEERESGATEAIIWGQLEAVITSVGIAALADSVLAYEPVWAIGTGKTASPEQAQEVHAFLRRTLAAESGTIADLLRILYGGSVNGGNAAQLFDQPDVDGGLVGGASLKSASFLEICAAA